MAALAANWDSEEWEVINDNGFVYKRKKRHTVPTSFARAPDPESNPFLEHKCKLKKRRMALLQIKDKYQRELALWDNLVNTFKAMEDRLKSKHQHKDLMRDGVEPLGPCNEESQSTISMVKNNGSLVQELLLKVEAQEATVHNFEQLCDVVDSFCDELEEKAKHDLFNLPIWNSPRELMASLSEDC